MRHYSGSRGFWQSQLDDKMTLEQMIHDAELKSARYLMKANDLREQGKNCLGCGCGFIPRIPGSATCPKCLRGLKVKRG